MSSPIEMKPHEEIALRAQDLFRRMSEVVLPLGDEVDVMSLLCALLLLEESAFQAAETVGLNRDLLKRQLRELFPDGRPENSPEDPN